MNQAEWPETRNAGEARVMLALARIGISPNEVEYQFRLGNYRLDFAFPEHRIAIESDGWAHTSTTTRMSDRKRDKKLREWGWSVVRVNADSDEDIAKELVSLIIFIRSHKSKPWFAYERVTCMNKNTSPVSRVLQRYLSMKP